MKKSVADLVGDLKLLRDLGLHCLHPFLKVSLTEIVDYNEHFFFRYTDFLPSKQGPTYNRKPRKPIQSPACSTIIYGETDFKLQAEQE